jgi:uncharacterized OB-fold protein
MAEDAKPHPRITELNRPFFESAEEGVLRLQQCENCQWFWFPPSSRCPNCLSTKYTWSATSGRGRVWSWIVMHQRYFKSFEADLPYGVGFIELEEGPFLISRITGVRPDEIYCDMAVEVTFETDESSAETRLPRFKPVANQTGAMS